MGTVLGYLLQDRQGQGDGSHINPILGVGHLEPETLPGRTATFAKIVLPQLGDVSVTDLPSQGRVNRLQGLD